MEEVQITNTIKESLLKRFELWAYHLERGDIKKLKDMINDGALDPNEVLINGITPLHISCIQGNLQGTKLLLNFDVDVEVLSLSKRTALDEALFYRHFNCAIEIMIYKENYSLDDENILFEQFLLF